MCDKSLKLMMIIKFKKCYSELAMMSYATSYNLDTIQELNNEMQDLVANTDNAGDLDWGRLRRLRNERMNMIINNQTLLIMCQQVVLNDYLSFVLNDDILSNIKSFL